MIRTVRPEQLSPEAKSLARSLVRGAAPKGVLVGALLGDEGWDVRPLVMDGGQMLLVRPLPPAMARAPREVLRRLFTQLSALSGAVPHWMGDVEGVTWIKRPFFQDLWENDRPGNLRSLLGDLAHQLYHHRLVHGHLSPSNLGLKEGRIIVLDWGVRVTSGVLSPDDWMAPESRRGGNITMASDVYSLGRLVTWAAGGDVDRNDQVIVEAMLSLKPEDRPSIESVAHHLAGRAWRSASPPRLVVEHAKEISPSGKRISESSTLGFWILFVAVCAAMIVWLRADWAPEERREGFPLAYWESGQPSLMEEVVRAAIEDPRSEAALVIVSDAIKGGNRRGIRGASLRIAFNGLWEKKLSLDDRRSAIMFACRSFLDGEEIVIAHPAVALAVLASVPANQRLPERVTFPPFERLFELPLPFGASFSSLAHLVSASYEQREVRALAHLLVGDVTVENVRWFLGAPSPRVDFARILLTLGEVIPSLEPAIVTALGEDPGRQEEFLWFNDGEAVSWEDVPVRKRLRVILGEVPERAFSIELLADLLSYPRNEIRQKALGALQREFLKGENQALVATLAKNADTIDRRDIVAIVSASYLQGDEAYALIDSWLRTEPDESLVAALLIERRNFNPIDPMSVEFARYLSRRSINLSVEEWQLLSLHKEPLARALAYSRLDPKDPDQRKVLEQMSQVEPGQRLRNQIVDKLREVLK